MDTFRLKDRVEGICVVVVVIADKTNVVLFAILKYPVKISCLLGYPEASTIVIDAGHMNAPRLQLDEEGVDGPKEQCFHGEEVTGQEQALVECYQKPLAHGTGLYWQWDDSL